MHIMLFILFYNLLLFYWNLFFLFIQYIYLLLLHCILFFIHYILMHYAMYKVVDQICLMHVHYVLQYTCVCNHDLWGNKMYIL